MKQAFDERLLAELKHVVVERGRSRGPQIVGAGMAPRRAAWGRRVTIVGGLAVAFVIAITAVLPTIGDERGTNPAYAVTENDDGTITVEIMSIEDAEGL